MQIDSGDFKDITRGLLHTLSISLSFWQCNDNGHEIGDVDDEEGIALLDKKNILWGLVCVVFCIFVLKSLFTVETLDLLQVLPSIFDIWVVSHDLWVNFLSAMLFPVFLSSCCITIVLFRKEPYFLVFVFVCLSSLPSCFSTRLVMQCDA